MARRKGGGLFTSSVTDAAGVVTNVTNWTSILVVTVTVVVVITIVVVVFYFALKPKEGKHEESKSGGGDVAPPMSQQPGRITIAEVAQAPSSGQAIIYFSQSEASGVTCDTCTAEFDVNITYTGGQPVPPPTHKKVTSPVLNGTVTFDYSVPTETGGTTPPLPIPPTQVSLDITARSINPQNGIRGGPSSFSKNIPYV